MSYSAAIFDLDGTLLNTLEDLCDAVNHVLEKFGYPLLTLEETKYTVGGGIHNLVNRTLPEGTTQEEKEAFLAEYRPYYASHSMIKTAPFPGIREMLAALHEAGIRCAVVSNKPHEITYPQIQNIFPGDFEVVVGARDGLPTKPAPDLVNLVLDELGVRADECIYVGDSDTDVETARNCGIPCIACTWGLRTVEELTAAGATVFVDTPEELRDTILRG